MTPVTFYAVEIGTFVKTKPNPFCAPHVGVWGGYQRRLTREETLAGCRWNARYARSVAR